MAVLGIYIANPSFPEQCHRSTHGYALADPDPHDHTPASCRNADGYTHAPRNGHRHRHRHEHTHANIYSHRDSHTHTNTHLYTHAHADASTDEHTYQYEPTPLGGGGGLIAFASDRSGMPNIWVINVDGTGLKQLTDLQDGACQPEWSPEGERLVFISPCDDDKDYYYGAGLFMMNADGPRSTRSC